MPHYMLLLHRDPNRTPVLSREEMTEVIRRYTAWGDSLQARGKLAGREKLAPGYCIRLQGGAPVVSDGPYPEIKDVIGGYYMIDARDEAEAKAIALECPHLWSTNWVELRPVDRTSVAEAQAHARAMSISGGVERQ